MNLTGITAGAGESQVLTITAASSNPGLIPNPTVTYTSPNTVATLTYTVAAQRQRHGDDHGHRDRQRPHPRGESAQRQHRHPDLHRRRHPVNQAPTLDPIPNPPVLAVNSEPQTITLTGISIGPGDSGQTDRLDRRHQQQPGADPQPHRLSYTNPNSTGTVTYQPRWRARAARR